MCVVHGGILQPFYPPTPKESEIPVATFYLDRTPVTNAQFLDFVKRHPEWRRDRIKGIFADERYLAHWSTPMALGPHTFPQQPVTQVSWFAARAYCAAHQKVLPTANQWEFAAQASDVAPDAHRDMAWRQRVLEWYTRPAPAQLPHVDAGTPNFYGLVDLHGLVWEWVADYNGNLIAADNRENATSPEKNRFCGAGAQVATEKEDYATFMRMAFRSALKASYTVANLGFRCARNLPGATP